jgi:ribonuclease P protein component
MARFAVLKTNTEFRTLYYRGKSYVHPALIAYVRKNRRGETRVGITTSKKLGNAVTRNRCRRVIREAYRALAPEVKSGYDIVFVARTRTAAMKSTALSDVMRGQLRAAGLLP